MSPNIFFVPNIFSSLPKEKEAKAAELKVSSGKKLPAIQIKDPVVQYYGWELGNVIKITRDTGIAYRIVVDEQI